MCSFPNTSVLAIYLLSAFFHPRGWFCSNFCPLLRENYCLANYFSFVLLHLWYAVNRVRVINRTKLIMTKYLMLCNLHAVFSYFFFFILYGPHSKVKYKVEPIIHIIYGCFISIFWERIMDCSITYIDQMYQILIQILTQFVLRGYQINGN